MSLFCSEFYCLSEPAGVTIYIEKTVDHFTVLSNMPRKRIYVSEFVREVEIMKWISYFRDIVYNSIDYYGYVSVIE